MSRLVRSACSWRCQRGFALLQSGFALLNGKFDQRGRILELEYSHYPAAILLSFGVPSGSVLVSLIEDVKRVLSFAAQSTGDRGFQVIMLFQVQHILIHHLIYTPLIIRYLGQVLILREIDFQ